MPTAATFVSWSTRRCSRGTRRGRRTARRSHSRRPSPGSAWTSSWQARELQRGQRRLHGARRRLGSSATDELRAHARGPWRPGAGRWSRERLDPRRTDRVHPAQVGRREGNSTNLPPEVWVMDADGANARQLDGSSPAALNEVGCVDCPYPPGGDGLESNGLLETRAVRLLVAIAAVLFAACGSASPSGPPPSDVFRADYRRARQQPRRLRRLLRLIWSANGSARPAARRSWRRCRQRASRSGSSRSRPGSFLAQTVPRPSKIRRTRAAMPCLSDTLTSSRRTDSSVRATRTAIRWTRGPIGSSTRARSSCRRSFRTSPSTTRLMAI